MGARISPEVLAQIIRQSQRGESFGGGQQAPVPALAPSGQTRIAPQDTRLADELTGRSLQGGPVFAKSEAIGRLLQAVVGADIRGTEQQRLADQDAEFDQAIESAGFDDQTKALIRGFGPGKREIAARLFFDKRSSVARSRERKADQEFTLRRDEEGRTFTRAENQRAIEARKEDRAAQQSFQSAQKGADRAFEARQRSLDRGQREGLSRAKFLESSLKAAQAKRKETVKETSDLRKEFTKRAGNYVDVRSSFQRVLAASEDPSPAGDLALIFNYMKILDPGSTVREGEFATAQNSGSIPQRIRAFYNKALQGTRLDDVQRADFADRANRLFKEELVNQKSLVQTYKGIASRNGLPEADVLSEDLTRFEELTARGDARALMTQKAVEAKTKFPPRQESDIFVGMTRDGRPIYRPAGRSKAEEYTVRIR